MNIAVLDVYGFQTCFGSAASAFENIELADIHCALKMNFSVTLRVWLATQLLNILTCVSLIYRELLVLGNWKVHQENRNHDWSKKWLQQNSRSAVKVIAKEGFISASRSKELNGPFYSYGWKGRWGWPRFETNLSALYYVNQVILMLTNIFQGQFP